MSKCFSSNAPGYDPATLLRTIAQSNRNGLSQNGCPQRLSPKQLDQRDLPTKPGKKEGKQGETKRGRPRTQAKARAPKPRPEAAGGRGRTELGRVKALLACAVLSVKTKKDIGEGRSHNKVEAPVPTEPEGSGAEPRNLPRRVRLSHSTRKIKRNLILTKHCGIA